MRVASRERVQIVVMTVVVAMLGAFPRARAAGPAQSLDDEKQARGLYERAEKSFDLGKFPEALGEYQSAYEAKPLPGFLFNIAQCYRNMGNWERARFFFRRYLALDPRASNRRRVEELIAEMTKQLAAQGAEAPTAPTAVPAPAVPGTTPAAGEPLTAAAPVGSSSAEILPLTAAASATAASAPFASAPSASAPFVTSAAPPPGERRPVWRRWWFWTGVGAVVAGGVVAAFFLTRPETRTPGSLEPIDGRL